MIEKRNIWFTLIMLCLTTLLAAQNEKVLLKNGSLVRGEIEAFEGDKLRIRVDGASVITIDKRSISRIDFRKRKNRLTSETIERIQNFNSSQSKAFFYHQLRFGTLNGEDANFVRRLSNLSMDYTFFRKTESFLHAGVGIALDYYSSFLAVPVFFELRNDFSHRPAHLFLYTRVGYARARVRDDFVGNFGNVIGKEMWAVGLGHEWPMGKTSLMISAGFRQQNLQTVLAFQDFRSETDWRLNRLDFKVGLRF